VRGDPRREKRSKDSYRDDEQPEQREAVAGDYAEGLDKSRSRRSFLGCRPRRRR
jgi:hypothetical protein